MYIYYCDKCRSFESFVGADEEWKCKECGGDLLPLGVTIDEWNAMTNDQMLETIDFAKSEYDKKNAKYDYSNVADEPKQPKPDVRVDLMECPDCFKMISPKSTKCPHCGHYFVNNPKAVRRRKAKRKLSLKIMLTALIPLLLGGVYEGIILSGKFFAGELTLLYATGSSMLYVVEYGGFVFVAAGVIMLLFGIIGFVKNKPYIAEKIKEDDEWQEGVIESSIVTHDANEDMQPPKEVIRPVEKSKAEEPVVQQDVYDELPNSDFADGVVNEEVAVISEELEADIEAIPVGDVSISEDGMSEEASIEEVNSEEVITEEVISEETSIQEVDSEESGIRDDNIDELVCENIQESNEIQEEAKEVEETTDVAESADIEETVDIKETTDMEEATDVDHGSVVEIASPENAIEDDTEEPVVKTIEKPQEVDIVQEAILENKIAELVQRNVEQSAMDAEAKAPEVAKKASAIQDNKSSGSRSKNKKSTSTAKQKNKKQSNKTKSNNKKSTINGDTK